MNDGRKQEIESVAQQLHMHGEFVPAIMLRELLADVDRLTGDNAALSEALDTALAHLKESEADRDKAIAQHNALLAILAEGAKNLKAAEAERDALAGELAKVPVEAIGRSWYQGDHGDDERVITDWLHANGISQPLPAER
jgi:replication fork clamp-binding protein CrfC